VSAWGRHAANGIPGKSSAARQHEQDVGFTWRETFDGRCRTERDYIQGIYKISAFPTFLCCTAVVDSSIDARTVIHLVAVVLAQGPTLCGSAVLDMARLLAGELLARLDGVGVQDVLEREQERSGDDALGDLGANTYYCQQPATARMIINSPPYKPLYPSSRMILVKVVNMLSLLSSLPATCILLLTVMYG